LAKEALAPATRAQYREVYKRFLHVVNGGAPADSGISAEMVEEFCARRFKDGVAYGTIHRELSAIRRQAIDRGVPVSRNSPLLAQALKGWKRQSAKEEGTSPIPFSAIQRYCGKVRSTFPFDSLLIKAVLACAFFGMLRVSEYTRKTHRDGRVTFLRRDQVSFLSDGKQIRHAFIHHAQTKTSRDKPGGERTTLWCSCVTGVCALHNLLDYLSAFDKRFAKSDQLFQFSNGRPLMYRDMTALVATIASAANTSKRWTPHSLRSGGATYLFLLDVPLGAIKILGRWSLKGDTLEKSYVKPRLIKVVRHLDRYFSDTPGEQLRSLGRFGELLV